MILRNQNPDEGGGDVFDAPQQGEPTGEPTSQPQGGDGGEPSGEPSSDGGTPQPPPQLTPEAIAAAIKQAGIGQQSQRTEEPQRTYTQEDFERAFNVFKPDPRMVEEMGVPEESREKALAVLAELAGGVNKQAVTMASYLVQQAKEELQDMLKPIQAAHIRAEEDRLAKVFFDKNKDLQPYESIVRAVVDQLKQSGYKPESDDKAMEEIANRSRAMLTGAGVKLNQLPNNQPSNQPGNMPRLPSGGQGGSGGRPTNQRPKGPAGIEVFD